MTASDTFQALEHYQQQYEQADMLRFITCGNVDDGKSTLIGRLLHDSRQVFEDQLHALERDSRKYNSTGEALDLALLVDGLQTEREQGITIDVAYRYFSTARRKFIIADCPGHEQYTRNMATGASTCDLAIILIDARHGVRSQTRRHSAIVRLLGIRHLIVAVNKMDLVDYNRAMFERICADYRQITAQLDPMQGGDPPELRFIPLSALRGDHVVEASAAMPWYTEPPLLRQLEDVELSHDQPLAAFRLPVQYVNRPSADFRGYCGTVASGQIAVGDTVRVLPAGQTSTVRSLISTRAGSALAGHDRRSGEAGTADTPTHPAGKTQLVFPLQQAQRGEAITLTLDDEIDLSRGDVLVRVEEYPPPCCGTRLDAYLVWMQTEPLRPGALYGLKLASKTVAARVSAIWHRLDVNTLSELPAEALNCNDIARCRIELESPLVWDAYHDCRAMGAFILIDRTSHATAGAGVILPAGGLPNGIDTPAVPDVAPSGPLDAGERAELLRLRALVQQLRALLADAAGLH